MKSFKSFLMSEADTGINKAKETKFHASLDKLVHKTFGKRKDEMKEGAPIVVAQAPIDVRNPKKVPQPYRNQGDIVPSTKPPSTEKRGVKGRPGQRPMPKYDEQFCEDGAVSAGPTNVVSSGAISGTGGLGGEPGVKLRKKKNEEFTDARLMAMGRRNSPKE